MSLPFTVVGGYLGAGKTTLLNRILTTATDTRFAVLVNDFGEINVDAELIARHEGDTFELTNGCVCCSLAAGFAQALVGVRSLDPAPDHVVVEASGVADPMTTGQYGRLPGLHLNAVLTLAGAPDVVVQLADPRIGATVRQQIERADLIVLTKLDRCRADDAAVARRRIATLTDAPVVDGTAAVPQLVAPRPTVDRPPVDPVGHRTSVWAPDGPLDQSALDDLLAGFPDDVVRAKGLVALDDGAGVLVQQVGRRLEVTPWPGPIEHSRLVLIRAPEARVPPAVAPEGEESHR